MWYVWYDMFDICDMFVTGMSGKGGIINRQEWELKEEFPNLI